MQLKDCINEQNAITAYLNNYIPNSYVESFINNHTEVCNLISTHFTPISETFANWTTESYVQNPYHPERLVHKSISGNYLRSKSEAMIDMALYNNKIPYRYECQLILGDYVYFPDFTVLHPRTKKLFYWEHMGMMSNPEYAKKASDKIHIYSQNNILPEENLILTYEFDDRPITAYDISKVINRYFLS